MKVKNLKKFGILMITVALLSISLSSCHRYGCPNKITDAQPTEQVEEKC